MKANYHCHTERCYHAIGEDEAFVQAAVKGGFDIFGIADHGPWPFEGGFVSRMRLKAEDAQQYIDTFTALKKKYAGQIEIHIGFEQEYWPRYLDYMRRLLDNGVEYFILGQHMLDAENIAPYIGQFVDTDEGVLRYADSVCEGIRTGLYSYIAHPDLFMIRRTPEEFNAACEQATIMIAQACSEQHIPLEYNLLGAGEHRAYPCEPFWALAVKHCKNAILGMDAHTPAALLNDALWQASRTHLLELGYHVQEKLAFKEV